MKVKVVSHTESSEFPWWYQNHIGEVFEAVPDADKPEYFLTDFEFKGKLQGRHIQKMDCEVLV